MPDLLTSHQVCRMLSAATEEIRRQQDMLSRLDAAVGDGDHGTTMLRAMETATKSAAENAAGDLKQLFTAVAWAVMGCDGGSTGPLLGSWFLGMGEFAAGKSELDAAAVAAMFDAGAAKMQKQSRAQVGDKTMMDAMLPAMAALKSADPACGIHAALQQAARASAQGADATRNMRAKFGRARNLGDRVLGQLDPGAVSLSLIFKGFCDGFAAR